MHKIISDSEKGIHLELSGIITSGEILELNQSLFKNENFESWKYQLWHFVDLEDVVLSTNEVRCIAANDKVEFHRNRSMRIAIVSESRLMFGLSRMYEAFGGEGFWETRTFYKLEEAHKWLGEQEG